MFTTTLYRNIFSIERNEIIVYDTRNNVWVGSFTYCGRNRYSNWRKILQFFKGVQRASSLDRVPNGYSPFPPVGYNNIPLFEGE